MKNKKGFTLIEILSTIVIIAILSSVTITSFIIIKNKALQKDLEAKLEIVELAAYKYGNDNKDDIWAEESGCRNITTNELINLGYLKSDSENINQMINPVTKKPINKIFNICYNNDIVVKDITIDEDYSVIENTFTYKCSNVSLGAEPFSMNYTGNCSFKDEGEKNWIINLLTSGEISFSKTTLIDAFLVGAGGGGSASYSNDAFERGGGAGGGGYVLTLKKITVTSIASEIIIGQGKNGDEGGTTFAFDNKAEGGKPGSSHNGGGGGNRGGNGWILNYGSSSWTNSTIGESYGGGSTCSFGEGNSNGCYKGNNYAYAAGGNGSYVYQKAKGSGHIAGESSDINGLPNTGGGGGGSDYDKSTGGSGIVIIRNAR